MFGGVSLILVSSERQHTMTNDPEMMENGSKPREIPIFDINAE